MDQVLAQACTNKLFGFICLSDQPVEAALFTATAALAVGILTFIGVLLTIGFGYRNAKKLKRIEQIEGETLLSDRELRKLRIDAYAKLWEKLGRFSKHATTLPTFGEIAGLADEITAWYYKTGGLMLTDPTRDVLFEVRDMLKELAKDCQTPLVTRIENPKYGYMWEAISSLRTCLTSDIFSRDEARLSKYQLGRRTPAERNMLIALRRLGLKPTQSRLQNTDAKYDTPKSRALATRKKLTAYPQLKPATKTSPPKGAASPTTTTQTLPPNV